MLPAGSGMRARRRSPMVDGGEGVVEETVGNRSTRRVVGRVVRGEFEGMNFIPNHVTV